MNEVIKAIFYLLFQRGMITEKEFDSFLEARNSNEELTYAIYAAAGGRPPVDDEESHEKHDHGDSC